MKKGGEAGNEGQEETTDADDDVGAAPTNQDRRFSTRLFLNSSRSSRASLSPSPSRGGQGGARRAYGHRDPLNTSCKCRPAFESFSS